MVREICQSKINYSYKYWVDDQMSSKSKLAWSNNKTRDQQKQKGKKRIQTSTALVALDLGSKGFLTAALARVSGRLLPFEFFLRLIIVIVKQGVSNKKNPRPGCGLEEAILDEQLVGMPLSRVTILT